MKIRKLVVEEPKIIEGVLVSRDRGFAGGDIEISPTARVVATVNGNMTSYTLESYDRASSFRGPVYCPLPERIYPRVRVTETRERETKRNDREYVQSGFVTTIVEDLDQGTKTENRVLDFVNSGYAFWNRIVRGTLEQLPSEQAREKLKKRKDPIEDAVVLGIRSLNGRCLIPIIFYPDREVSIPQEAYGHRVHFQEGMWNHDIDGLGNDRSFDQLLRDLETGKDYSGGADHEMLSPRRLERLRQQAKKFSKKSGIRF